MCWLLSRAALLPRQGGLAARSSWPRGPRRRNRRPRGRERSTARARPGSELSGFIGPPVEQRAQPEVAEDQGPCLIRRRFSERLYQDGRRLCDRRSWIRRRPRLMSAGTAPTIWPRCGRSRDFPSSMRFASPISPSYDTAGPSINNANAAPRSSPIARCSPSACSYACCDGEIALEKGQGAEGTQRARPYPRRRLGRRVECVFQRVTRFARVPGCRAAMLRTLS